MTQALIAPSLLSANFLSLENDIHEVEEGGADLLHLDVMDGHFVPNLTFGPFVIAQIAKVARLPLDVHLMIEEPERWVKHYVEAGANWLTLHSEVSPHLHRSLESIRESGALPGVAINPSTPLEAIDYVLEGCHHILVMTVNPGFGGQSFISSQLRKIEALRERIEKQGLKTIIEVDGGITVDNIALARQAGAEAFVAGSAIFGKANRGAAIDALREAAGA